MIAFWWKLFARLEYSLSSHTSMYAVWNRREKEKEIVTKKHMITIISTQQTLKFRTLNL